MKVFLGGTCNETTWRDKLSPLLDEKGIEYFNPVVDDWTEEMYQIELDEKELCDVFLVNITPKMTGVFSIAEVVESVFNEDKITLFSFQSKDGSDEFDEFQIKSLEKVGEIIDKNDGVYLGESSVEQIAEAIEMLK